MGSVVAAAALASTAEPTLLAQLKRFTDHPFHCAFLFVSGIPCHLPVEGIFQRRPISPDEWEEEPKFQVRRPSTRPARLQSKRFPFAVAAADAISKNGESHR